MKQLSLGWCALLTISFLFITMNTHAAGLGVSASDTPDVVSNQLPPSGNRAVGPGTVPDDKRRMHLAAIGYHSLPQQLETRPQQVVLNPNNAPDCQDTVMIDTTSYNHQSVQCPQDYVAVELDSTAFAPFVPNSSASQFYSNSQSRYTKPRYYLRCCKAKVAYPA